MRIANIARWAAALALVTAPGIVHAEESYLGGGRASPAPAQSEGYLPDAPRNSTAEGFSAQPWQARSLAGSTVDVGFAAGPDVRMGFFSGEPSVFVGGGGSLILGHVVGLGGAGWHGVTRTSPPDAYASLGFDRDAASVEIGYGGFVIEGWVFPEYIVHLHVHAMLGGGRASLVESATGRVLENASTQFFASELGAAAEVNLTTFLRLRAGAAYRLAAGSEAAWLRDSDLFSPMVSVGLRFGWF